MASPVTVTPIEHTPRQLKRYVQWGIDLYRGNPYYVPPLVMDDVNTLRRDVNPAFNTCEAQCFAAYRDGKMVGRITAIINRLVNEKNSTADMRFAFTDFIDDYAVSEALFAAAEAWGRERGMTHIVGPLGFTDMDHEGLLVEGFAEQGTMATLYNYPYYVTHLERLGFKPDNDWVEYLMTVPDRVPDKYLRIADIVRRKYGLDVKQYKSRRQLRADYGQALFELINDSYDDLYGYSPLTQEQIDYYIGLYLGILSLKDICVIVDKEGTLVGVGISIPSYTKALQRSRGKMWPMGWRHFIGPLRGKSERVDLLLVAIRKDYQSKGVNALLFSSLLPNYIAAGYRYAESNPEMEENEMVQRQWQYFERRQHRRRRSYRKPLAAKQPMASDSNE